jgi:two-component system, sensor histidine kinase and response regulator
MKKKRRYPCVFLFLISVSFLVPGRIFSLNPRKKITQYIHESWGIEQGLPQNTVETVIQDNTGYLWLGTQEGLVRFDGVRFTTFDRTNLDALGHNWVEVLYHDRRDCLWIGTYGGVNRLKPVTGEIISFTARDGLSNNLVRCIYKDRKGNVWAGTTGGLNLLQLQPGNKTVITRFTTREGLADDLIWSLYEDRKGNLWIGTDGGLNRLDRLEGNRAAFTTFTTKQGLSNEIVKSISEDRAGNLWLGTMAGLNRLKNGYVTVYTTREGLSSNIIRCFHEDEAGLLWIGTSGGGLNRLEQGAFTFFTSKDGLFSDSIQQIMEDRAGNFWMSCNKGIFRVNKRELEDYSPGKSQPLHCTSYDEKDGMKNRECNGSNQPVGWKTRDGKLWFPTIKGIVVIDPRHPAINRQPPEVAIEKITADHTSVERPFLPLGEKITFSPGNQRIEIHYTGLSLVVPQRVRFAYRLEGYDRQWLQVGTRRIAYYTNLPPGPHTFRVKACNNDGVWNETGTAISFSLKPYFYQAPYFFITCAVILIFLTLGGYRLRLRRLTRRKIELEGLVAERTSQLEQFNSELAKLSIVARETDNAVTIMDEKGNLQWINEGFTRMYGYTLEQLIEARGNHLEAVSLNPDINKIFEQFISQPKPTIYEVSFRGSSDEEKWTQTTLTPIFNPAGKLSGIVAIDTDISKIKQSEQQIKMQNERMKQQAQELAIAVKTTTKEREAAKAANQAKSEFLARMSHEIRTPMNGVIGFADMLMETELSTEQLDYVKTIKRSGEALTHLINDILDLSKIEAGELSIVPIDFDPEVTVFDVFEIIAPRIGGRPVEMVCSIGDDVPTFVRGDAGRFRQVIVNLLGNAAKFTSAGEIELSLHLEEEKADQIKLHAKIRDTGIGITAGKLEAIFDPFQQADGSTTREYGGTGLGLSISKQIAILMGGDVWAESTPGEGSTFHFTAWFEKSTKEPEKKIEIPEKVLAGKKILVVDDNQANLEILTHLLKRFQVEVVALNNSDEVIPSLKTSFSRHAPVHLCIIDIYMPRLSGYEVAQQIRELAEPLSDLPLLAYSSSTALRSGNYKGSGFDGFIPKPVQGKKLVEVVAHLLKEKQALGNAREESDEKEDDNIITRHTIAEEAKHSIHILLAEDNPINRKLAHFMLTKAGYRLTIVSNGKEALEAYIAEPDTFDLIFMDVQMPHIDGRTATRLLREKGFKKIPIIAMTAQTMKGDREKCLEAGMDDYIAKPIKREVVFAMVKKWCLENV